MKRILHNYSPLPRFKNLIIIINISLFLLAFNHVFIGPNFNNLGLKILLETNVFSKTGVSVEPRVNRHNIFTIWTGKHIPIHYVRYFQALLFHHPNSDVFIYSNDLERSIFEVNHTMRNFEIVKYNLTIMTKDKPGHDFAQTAELIIKNRNENNLSLTRVHLSDFLRYFLIYNYGGLYIDMDMVALKNLEFFKNTISVDVNNSYVCHDQSYNKGDLKDISCLCNCIFSFEKGHSFMKDALENYKLWWEKEQGYGPGGAIMLMSLLKNHLNSTNLIATTNNLCNPYRGRYNNIVNEKNKDIQDIIYKCNVYHQYAAGQDSWNYLNFNQSLLGHIIRKILNIYEVKLSTRRMIFKNLKFNMFKNKNNLKKRK